MVSSNFVVVGMVVDAVVVAKEEVAEMPTLYVFTATRKVTSNVTAGN